MDMLHHEIVAAPGTRPARTLIVLHGIFGHGRNWKSVAARLVRDRPDWAVALADLRGHGRSPGWAQTPTVEACARDVQRLEERMGAPTDAVLGHSLGGKVALLHARLREPSAPVCVWAVDTGLGVGRPAGGAWRMLAALRKEPGPFGSRAEAARAIASQGFADAVAKWMATNMRRAGDAWEWRLSADEMEPLLRDGFATPAWDVIENAPPGASIHVVKATGSSVLGPVAADRLRKAARHAEHVHFHEADGGHWLHVDNPQALHRLLVRCLPGANG